MLENGQNGLCVPFIRSLVPYMQPYCTALVEFDLQLSAFCIVVSYVSVATAHYTRNETGIDETCLHPIS